MLEKLTRLVALRREEEELCRQIDAEHGIHVIPEYWIHLYNGIEDVEAATGIAAEEDSLSDGKMRKTVLIDGYPILQLGQSDGPAKYRKAEKHEAV